MIAPSPDSWLAMWAIMTAIGAACVIAGLLAGAAAADRHHDAERTIGQTFAALIRLRKLRLVLKLTEVEQEAQRLERSAGELTGLNKTLESELRVALDSAQKDRDARDALEQRLAVEVDARAGDVRRIRDQEDRYATFWTTCLALTESWAKVAPQASVDMARRELAELLNANQPHQITRAAA
ncbi:hypothetical protein [Nonomuraea sp. bgisy101]|uniref:hypothetical protein n=1 Tax=Nonomuraea sp. bgisy101 TaxID=3413784 RepID=UPI003D7298C7